MRPAASAVLLLALCSGCTHPLLLKKYAATGRKVPALSGKSVFVAPFTDERRVEWNKSQPLPDPPRWEAKELTSAQLDQWEAERRKLEDQVPQSSQFHVGQKRNGFGAPIKDLYSVTSPEQWLADSTRMELVAQGATLAQTPEAADIVVQGIVRHVWLDLYLVTWVHLVLDLTVTVRGQPPRPTRLHVSDGKMAWSGGDSESFELFTSAEQKLQWYVLQELARGAPDVGTAPPSL
jgi:hypothetical protein